MKSSERSEFFSSHGAADICCDGDEGVDVAFYDGFLPVAAESACHGGHFVKVEFVAFVLGVEREFTWRVEFSESADELVFEMCDFGENSSVRCSVNFVVRKLYDLDLSGVSDGDWAWVAESGLENFFEFLHAGCA